MSLKKLNLNSMKVAQPLSEATLNLLDNLANIYSNDVVVSNNITNFEEDRDEIIDIEVCSDFKNVNDMVTQTKQEIKDLGFETSFIYNCMKIGKTDEEIMDICSINRNRLNKNFNKLKDLGYIRSNGYTLLKIEDGLNVPQNASSEVLETNEQTIEQNKNKETDMTPTCLIQDNVSPIEIADEHFMTIPTKVVGKTQDEILFDLNQKIYIDSHAKQNKKGEVFSYENSDRASLAEMENYPPKPKKNNFIVTI